MKSSQFDLDTKFEYLIIYTYEDKLNTWTLPDGSFQLNYKQMKNDKKCNILGVYKKISDSEMIDTLCK